MKHLLAAALISALLSPAFAQEDSDPKGTINDFNINNEQLFFISPEDLEKGHISLDVDVYHKSYKHDGAHGGSYPYTSLPTMFRMDMGDRLEFRTGGEVLIYQLPSRGDPSTYGNIGLGDLSTGIKYRFYKSEDLNAAMIGMITFPTGDWAQTDAGIEGTYLYSAEYTVNSWSVGGNLGTGYMHDKDTSKNYWQPIYALWLTRHMAKGKDIGLTYSGYQPNAAGGHPIDRIYLGYTHDMTSSLSLEANVGHDLNVGGAALILTAGVSWKIR